MKKLVSQYINREIKDEESLAKLRDDSEFMLEVFETKMKAVEFDNVSDRLKDDEKFIKDARIYLVMIVMSFLVFVYHLEIIGRKRL
ncbi:MAG: hypothetical protein OSJ70_01615 [Bacilli bacterium]|nr:hypothetical protein [Bacilli bacterium]